MPDAEVLDLIRELQRPFDEADPDTWTDADADRIYRKYADTTDPLTPEQANAMWDSFGKFAGWDKDGPSNP